jgi:hypothetical protein
VGAIVVFLAVLPLLSWECRACVSRRTVAAWTLKEQTKRKAVDDATLKPSWLSYVRI